MIVELRTYLETEVLQWREFDPELASQSGVGSIALAESADRLRFDFPFAEFTATSAPCVNPKMNCVSTSPARATGGAKRNESSASVIDLVAVIGLNNTSKNQRRMVCPWSLGWRREIGLAPASCLPPWNPKSAVSGSQQITQIAVGRDEADR